LCEGESIIINGNTYDANMDSGTEILENAAANGCDSIINVNLTFLESPQFDFNPQLCAGESIIVNGNTYDANMDSGTEILENAAANGCDSIINVNLTFLESPQFDFNPQLCEGESIIVNGNTYDTSMTSGTEILENAAANGCDSIINVNLTFLESPQFDFNPQLCEGESIIVNGNTYDTSMTSGTEILENAAANGCDSIVNIILSFLDAPEFDLEQTLCAGESIVVNGTTYDANLPAGTEVLEGAAANGCDSIVNVSLSFYSHLTASISGDANICAGESTSLVINFNGDETFTVQYSGENGATTLLNNISDGYLLEVSPSSTTSYSIDFIIVSDTNCPVDIESGATVNVSELTATVSVDQDILCGNSTDGVLSANANGGLTPYVYSWSNGAVSASIDNLGPGTYSVQVTDIAGCVATTEVTLNAPDPITIYLTPEAPDCFDDQSGSLNIASVSGGTGNYEYSLDGEFFQPLPGLPFAVSGLNPGDYTFFIQDGNDCLTGDQVSIPVNEPLLIDLGPDVFIDLGNSIILNGVPNFDVDSLIWIPSDSLTNPELLTTQATPSESTTYALWAFDDNGCPAYDEITVIVNRDVPVFIPTAFSPNGDGINDNFTVFGGQGVAMVNSLRIFDRWGNSVFEGGPFPPNDPNFGWNGKYQGQPMNSAVFVYYTEVVYLDGRTEVIKGEVTLVR
jgi:gliding motility-associated-like protein